MNAFTQAFGPKAQAKSVINGEAQVKTPQDDMMMRMLKMMIPDFDPSVITNMGQKMEMLTQHYIKELADIKRDQQEILRLLRERDNDGR